jgi:hypothetical protein
MDINGFRSCRTSSAKNGPSATRNPKLGKFFTRLAGLAGSNHTLGLIYDRTLRPTPDPSVTRYAGRFWTICLLLSDDNGCQVTSRMPGDF